MHVVELPVWLFTTYKLRFSKVLSSKKKVLKLLAVDVLNSKQSYGL